MTECRGLSGVGLLVTWARCPPPHPADMLMSFVRLPLWKVLLWGKLRSQ